MLFLNTYAFFLIEKVSGFHVKAGKEQVSLVEVLQS